jgi:hypothetical protein
VPGTLKVPGTVMDTTMIDKRQKKGEKKQMTEEV